MREIPTIYEGFKKIDRSKIEDLEKYILLQLASDRAKIAGLPKIAVGTDSKFHPKRGGYSVTYITTIIYTFGNTGTHVTFRKEILNGTGKLSLFDRLWKEVTMTVDLATWIREKTGISAEVHLDINPKKEFESNVLYSAAIGYGESLGFIVEAKPKSPAAMNCSDQILRGKM